VTITYDPRQPAFLDEADTRSELTRVFDVCTECRRCADLCHTFPSLFELIRRRGGRDAGLLTPAEQDAVVDSCVQCQLCTVRCPYTPGRSELAIDFARLMVRAAAMRTATGEGGVRRRVTTRVLGHTDLIGRSPVAHGLAAAAPGSVRRRMIGALTGVSAVRLVPPFARQRFSTWFKRRPTVPLANRRGSVAVFPTCLVEYQRPAIGQDLVKVYERNGIECTLVDDVRCCGAPWLHHGDVGRFTEVAAANLTAMAAAVHAGHEVVVPQATCAYVLRRDSVHYVPGPNASAVAGHVHDAAEYLAASSPDVAFTGEVPATIAYHVPCHLRAQEVGIPGRDLLALTGAKITLVERCAGIGALWGMRAQNDAVSGELGAALADEVRRTGADVVVGDCQLAGAAITEHAGADVLHPLEVLARAYGLAHER
jgi:glycerol-3-phosphate dehydrogenase subunit C